MKKKIYFLATAFMLMLTAPNVMAKDDKPALTDRQKVRVEEIARRVEEIKSIDRSELTKEERKELRQELTEMKKEAKAVGGGVYLSVGAIIIIILLLILIL